MAGLIQQLTDITLTATPSVGSYLLSIDLDGVLKYKTDSGTISPVGSGVAFTLIQEDLSSGLSFLPASGLTHSEFFGPSGSILLLQNDGDFRQTNSNSNFQILNVEMEPTFNMKFAGVKGETASGSIQFFNGSYLNGNIIAYVDGVNNEIAVLAQDSSGFDISYSDGTGASYGTIISVGTNSLDFSTRDVNGLETGMIFLPQAISLEQTNLISNKSNAINLTDPFIKVLLATQSTFSVIYWNDPFGSPIEEELFQIGHNGDFRLSNKKATGTVSLVAGSASVVNPLVTPNSIILTTKQNTNSTYSIASVEQFGGSFSIYSSNPVDNSVVGYFIINTI